MELAALAAENETLRAQGAALRAQVEAQAVALDKLAAELAALRKQLAGPRSERLSAIAPGAQQQLLLPPLPGDGDVPAPPAPPPPRAAPHGRREPATGATGTVTSPAPGTCAACGGDTRSIGVTAATRVEWRKGHFVNIRVEREKCACGNCGRVETAPEPVEFALPRSVAGNGLLARVVVDRFAGNIPLDRQVERFEREGLDFNVSTLCDWVRGVAALYRPLVLAMTGEQRDGTLVQADDTGLPVLDGTPGATGKGRLWVYAGSGHVVYAYTSTKHGAGPAAYLEGFRGTLLADGGSEFNRAVREAGITRAGCWSHARRYFVDAREQQPALALQAIHLAGEMFAIERRLAGAALDERRRARDTESRAAAAAFHAWLVDHVHRVRPTSGVGKGIQYCLHQWEELTACLGDPGIPIHHNLSELQPRRPVIGRKNWLFAGSEGGAASGAVLFSLVGSCALHGLDPLAYLEDTMGRIGSHPVNRVIELSPARVAASARAGA